VSRHDLGRVVVEPKSHAEQVARNMMIPGTEPVSDRFQAIVSYLAAEFGRKNRAPPHSGTEYFCEARVWIDAASQD